MGGAESEENMNIFLILSFLFFIGSCLGWCMEVIFRRFFSRANPERKWINPGFLVGPYLPIYGFGLCLLYLLASLERFAPFPWPAANKIFMFVLMAVCMTVVEYVGGVIFIQGMHVKLWDYSHEKLNYKGIICLKFSLIWAALGAVYYFFIHSYVLHALTWLSQNLAISFFIGLFMGVLIVDFFYSANVLSKIRAAAKESGIIVKYEGLKAYIQTERSKRKERLRFLLAFRSEQPLSAHVKEYVEKQKEHLKELEQRLKK